MRRVGMNKLVGFLIMVMVAVVPISATASDSATIEGEINDSYQIVASDGQVYEVLDTPQGNELVDNHVGEKVKVTGTVQEEGAVKTIGVTTFTLIK
jgi:hypothetical protein